MSPSVRGPLLSEKSYDDDAALIESGSGSEFESDIDETYNTSQSPERFDRQVLEDAEQEENLLKKPGRFDGVKKAFSRDASAIDRIRRRNQRRAQRLKEEAQGSGNASLIYEMESGYKDGSSRSSRESLVLANEKWNQEPQSRRPVMRLFLITIGIACLFVLLGYGSFSASNHTKTKLYSNGTHTFGPTTILISLDGFRADFLQRDLTPAMNAFIKSGVSPKYMNPSFPSVTFPNHFTLVTGLYPESHGIVSNEFWDPTLQEEFYYTNTSNSMQPKWWNGEPLWVTAENAGLKTAIHMWPGSEAHISNLDPTYLDKYNGSEVLGVKVDRILHWLDLPQAKRPQFIGAYVPNVDSDGHKFGPNSTEIRATIAEVDSMLTNLIQGLFVRNLTEVVNIVVVSDHGMATTSNDRLIQLDDLIDLSLVDHTDGWPLVGLRLKNPSQDVPILYQQLLTSSKAGGFDVYTLDNMPERYHFTRNERIAPLWIVPKVGWAIVEKKDFDITEAQKLGKTYHPKGLHGYDHEHPLMRAIFIARGPAFPHPPNSRVAPFQNIEVYNIVCDSLGIKPQSNNGTLRLPLTMEGLHSDFGESEDLPVDPVSSSTEVGHVTQVSLTTTSSALETPAKTAPSEQPTAPTGVDDTPTDNKMNEPPTQEKQGNWWDFLNNQLEKAKEWAKELIDSIRNNNEAKTTPTV